MPATSHNGRADAQANNNTLLNLSRLVGEAITLCWLIGTPIKEQPQGCAIKAPTIV